MTATEKLKTWIADKAATADVWVDNQAFKHGQKARRKGKTPSDNPFKNRELRDAWIKGFEA